LVVAMMAGAIAFFFREQLLDEWRLRQFRQAAAADDADFPQYQERLLRRLLANEVKLDLAARLAYDTDPKVRVAAVDVLLANQPRAQKQDARPGLFAVGKTAAWRIAVEEAVKHLLEDHDEAVRQRALRAVSELEWAGLFEGLLEDALKTGSPEERTLVAERLAHWNAWLLWQTIADGNQPDEVRLAAMRSLDLYGDKEIAGARADLQNALETALRSETKEMRRAALGALRYAGRPAFVWLDILCDERHKVDRPLVLQTWIDRLGSETVRGRRLRDVHGNIVSVVSAVRWYCVNVAGDKTLEVWLPHETPRGAPPRRKLKAFLFGQVRPIWEWCSDKRTAYPTRFLTANNIKNYGSVQTTGPASVRPLGAVMDELLIGQTEYQMLQNRYGGK
jgi:hypothetical protein